MTSFETKRENVSGAPGSRLPRPMRLLLIGNALATAACLLTELICKWLGYPETYFNPFFIGFRFYDFDSFLPRFQHLHQAAFFALDTPFPFSYPAPAALIYVFFYRFGWYAAVNVFLGFATACAVLVTVWFARALVARGVATRPAYGWCFGLLAVGYPFWFLFQRANIEIVPFMLIAAGVWCFVTGRGYWAAVFFGLAASIKVVPILYLALPFSRKQYRQVALGVLVAGLTNLFSLWFIGPTVETAWVGLGQGAAAFHWVFLQGYLPDSIGFDHSLLGVWRRFAGIGPRFPGIFQAYTILTATWGTALYFLRIRRMPMMNQVMLITVAAIWLPPVSFEYTLMQIYLCIGLLALATLSGGREDWARLTPFLMLCGLLVSPASEFILHGVRFGGQVKSGLLLALFVLALRRPIQWWPESSSDPGLTTAI